MFSAFSLTSESSDELKAEIIRNSYVLPMENFQIASKAKVSDKSFYGKSSRSFYGCAECKLRKKKCDEVKPTCSSCAKRKVKCTYSNNVFKRKPNPTYPKRKNPAQDIEDYEDENLLLIEAPVPAMSWTSPSMSPADADFLKEDDLESFLNSILADFPYAHPEDLAQKPIIEISEVPVMQQEITAMDESQIVQNISIKDRDDDDLLLRFIVNVKSHPESISDEELSKYVSSGYDDFTIFKEILLDFLSGKYDHLVNVDEVDKFYLASFCSAFSEMCSFTSSNEDSFCHSYYEMAQTDDSVLFSLVSLGANYVSYQTSTRAQESMKKSLAIYGENLSRFTRHKQETGKVDLKLTTSIMTNLVIYSHIGLLHGNNKEWMQYHILLEKFVKTHFGTLTEFVKLFKVEDPKLIKVITTFIFSHRVLTITNKPAFLEYQDLATALEISRTHYNEFDSTMGYCAGIYIQLARVKDLALKNSLTGDKFDEIETALINEKPNTDSDLTGFNEEDLELHMTFFEVQQISARLYLRLISGKLEPRNEVVIDLLLNLLGSLQILLKTSFEAYFGLPLFMCRLTVSESKHERVLQNIIAHVKSHNQVGSLLRMCMFLDELLKEDSTMERRDLYYKTLNRLNWDVCFCC